MARHLHHGLLIALLAGVSTMGAWAQTSAPPAAATQPAPLPIPPLEPSDGYLEVREQIAPGVHLIRQANPFHIWPSSNVTVFEQSDGLVLVDAGNSPAAGDRVIRLIREISSKPVKAVIVTHGHYDHLYGLVSIRREWPNARIIATQATHDYIEGRYGYWLNYAPDQAERDAQRFRDQAQGAMREAVDQAAPHPDWERAGNRQTARELQQAAMDLPGATRILPDVVFTDRYVIPDRDNPVEARFVGRANTHGDAIAWAPRARVVAAGDIVVSPVPYGFNLYVNDMLGTLERLKALNFAVLIPGHGLPQRDSFYLDILATSIRQAQEKVRPLVAQGLTADQVQERAPLLDDQFTLFGLTDPWQREIFHAYWAGALMRSIRSEMVGEPNRYEADERPGRPATPAAHR